jgi:hypothetical protein
MVRTNITGVFVKLSFLIALCMLLAGSISPAAVQNGQDWGAPKIEVAQEQGRWIVKGLRNRMELQPADLQMTVRAVDRAWSMIPSSQGDLVVENVGERLSLRLTDAGKKQISPYHTGFKSGLKIDLNDFAAGDKKIELPITLLACLEGPQEELVCELVAAESTTTVMECFWPRAVAGECFDYTVIPFMQGMFLPKSWPEKVRLYDTMCYGRGLYMPWWGHQSGKSAMLVLIETPEDAGCRFDHPVGGPTKMELRWVHSLGK